MASLPNPRAVTYEEWLRMPEVHGEEVVDGIIVGSTPISWTPTELVENLAGALTLQVSEEEVEIKSSPFNLVMQVTRITGPPDVAVFQRDSIIQSAGGIRSAPQLVVEVLSDVSTRRDYEVKLGDYAALGVPEVWVVAPQGQTVEVLYLEEGRLKRSEILAEGTLTPRLFPQVHIDISTIWPA